MPFDGNVLFNCCADCKAPDWAEFDALEAYYVEMETLPDGSTIEHNLDIDKKGATHYTVFGHLREGGIEAITDVPLTVDLSAIVVELERRSGLRLAHGI